jgi:NADP-dependent 3-hydroxy acid dehydrogenase YdfG
VIADIHEERLAETATAVRELGQRCLPVRCDVTRDADVDALASAAFAEFGRIDLLMNNAGIAVLGPSYRVAMAEWERILQVNVLGIVRGVRAFVPAMVERGSGYVVNTASIAGIWAYSWDCAPYITSKFAAYGYSEALARSLRPLGIGVSVLCPGLVHTNLGEHARISGVPDEHAASWVHFPSEMADDAVDADAVGPMVCDAVESERFTIFTNANDGARYRTWRDDIDASLADAIAAAPTPPRIV